MFGSPRVSKVLSGVLKTSRIANAYLFLGPDQASIQVSALDFAKALNCLSQESRPCGECLNCKLIANAKFVDVLSVAPVGTSIKIDQIREIKSIVKFGPNQGKYLVVLIQAADKMTTEAANSFLKILEEPKDHVVFVLMASSPYAILPTIKSRCHKVAFPDGALLAGEDEASPKLLNLLKKHDINQLFFFSKAMARDKSNLEQQLVNFMLFLRNNLLQSNPGANKILKIVMDTIKGIKRKAAARVALDAMFLKLLEVF